MTVSSRKTMTLGICLMAAAVAAYTTGDINLFLGAVIICIALRVSGLLVDLLHEGELSRRVARH
jgi:hypothetical protein